MNIKNIWGIVKNRYRLSTKIQMSFELSFPKYLIGKCCFTTNNAYQIRTHKVSPSIKGVVFSDTIPLSLFTSSAFIPWEKVLKIVISNTPSSIDAILNMPSSSKLVPYHLVFCHKKQENYAAISRSCSVDAAKKAFNMFVNFTPLSVI